MEIVYDLLVVLHLLGMAAVVGSWLTVVREPRFVPWMRDGAGVQVVTGLALVGLASSGVVDHEVDNTKIAVKLLVALAVLALAIVAGRRRPAPAGMIHAIGGLAVLNVLVAVLWG